MNKQKFAARVEALHELGCICCWLNDRRLGLRVTGQFPEIHHLNFGGKHGGERMGDRFTIPLCPWHHRAVPPRMGYPQGVAGSVSLKGLSDRYGPSWAEGGKGFHAVYPGDRELLALVDERIGAEEVDWPPEKTDP